jgi:selenocysteine lyase/cysteine desulfurase
MKPMGIASTGNDLPSQRQLFDIPPDIAYFNCAYNAPQLNASRDALLAGARSKSHPWERTAADFFDNAETIRQLAAELFGGSAEGYAIVPSASYGMSSAARALEPQLNPGERILMLAHAFPSEYLPWQRVAAERGCTVEQVANPGNGEWSGALIARIERGVRAVVVPHCHWSHGARLDLAAIGRRCREYGVFLAIDATQSLGAMPLDIDTIDPDFLVAAGYKWLLAPYGFSLLYVAARWHGARPLEESWLARQGARDFAALADYSPHYQPGARRFDMGEKCIPTLLPGAIAALQQIREWGVEAISHRLAHINRHIAATLQQAGCELLPEAQRAPHILGIKLPAHSPADLLGKLTRKGIYISRRGDHLRIAPHLHIDARDISRLETALCELLEKVGG